LRTVADSLDKYFTANGIGTFIGEWGLLGYDTDSAGALQAGEELKYYEEFLAMVRSRGFACAFWDNGTGIDRTDVSHGYPWKKPRVGEVMTAGLTGRSAYAKGSDTVYLGAAKGAETSNSSDLRIPLVLNGLSFVSVSDGRGELTEDHYSFDSQSSSLILSAAYIRHIAELREADGILADLTLHFSAGADWHEYIIRASQPQVLQMPLSDQDADRADDTDDRAANDQAALDFHEQQVTPAFWKEIVGTREQGITIPLRLNGNELKSVAARRVEAGVTGSQSDPHNSWLGPQSSYWDMLQNGGSFTVHTDSDERLTGSLTLLPAFFECESVQKTRGPLELFCTFQSGATLRIVLLLQSDRVILIDGE
jgi:endoglucanase